MNLAIATRWVLLLACAMTFASRAPAQEASDKPSDNPVAKKEVVAINWSPSLDDGYRRAVANRKPLVIVAGAKWCAACRQLAMEVEMPAVQAELARWTPVYLDLESESTAAEELGVVTVPALWIRTPDGQQVVQRDGYLTPDELVEWLKKHYEAATAGADAVLLDSAVPGATAVVRLVKQFQQRNPVLREAAIRRLLSGPSVARPLVLKTLKEGNLTARLAAMEVLEEWRAPLEGLDPWRPETLTPERFVRLEQWQQREVAGDRSPLKELSPGQLAGARRQIDRMLVADEIEADAIRHRLARLGPPLVAEVYTRLKSAAADQDRRRLLTLRYRLVAPDSLVLRWPGGLQRLANPDPRQRQQAADELAGLAGDDDQPLLSELFADPDPLVREISLRGLQHIGGSHARAALVKLLSDPEPNVRAAVLKQLEEDPDAAMLSSVVEYLAKEKDSDLIVHGIRFLEAAKGAKATKCLVSLLKHESWQVRAEAAAAIGKLSDRSYSFDSSPAATPGGKPDAATQAQADAYVALVDLLEDVDAFVVAKAVEGLSHADLAVAVEPLAKTAAKHPELAANVLPMLAAGNAMRSKAIPHLRKFCKHDLPQVRAAAIAAICQAAPDDAGEELLAALDDRQSEVRIAAASALFQLLNTQRERAMNERNIRFSRAVDGLPLAESSGFWTQAARLLGLGMSPPPPTVKKKNEEKPDEKKADEEKNPADVWLEECYAGRHRPKWTAGLTPRLEKMLDAEIARERLAAAMALVPLGKMAEALPTIEKSLKSNPELFESAQPILPWLTWPQRLTTFQAFQALATTEEDAGRPIASFSEVHDRRAADPLWELLADANLSRDRALALMAGLRGAYLGNQYYSPSQVPASARRELAKAAKPRTQSGSALQRIAALVLLAAAAPDEAAEAAARLADDAQLDASSQADAFQVQLVTLPAKEARRLSLTILRGTDKRRAKVALKCLAEGADALHSLASGFYLFGDFDQSSSSNRRDGTPIVPEAPPGLEAKDVRPHLSDSDPEVAACAGYLLAVLGEPEGVEPLVRYWRQEGKAAGNWSKLVYRAIAVANDPKYIGALREIYEKMRKYEVEEFYWTIRIMSGPEILKFRKQVRDEMKTSPEL